MAEVYVEEDCNSRSGVLAMYRENMERFLLDVDLVKLSVQLFKHQVIAGETKENFASLDSNEDHLDSDVKVRYLLQQVCQRVREDEKVYDRLVRVLSKFGRGVRGVCEAMRKKLDEVEGGKNSDRKGSGVERNVSEKDVPYLTKILVSGSYRWEAIGIELQLPYYILDDCRKCGSNAARLSNVLTAWASGSYKRTEPATLERLRAALAGEMVGLKNLAHKLGNMNLFKECLPVGKKQTEISCKPELIYQSYSTEVCEGKSTLLEVQVSCNGCKSYQWSKDGNPLPDGTDFSGVCRNILYINRAGQDTEGKYSCTVSSGSETVCSDEINLKVLYPPEKEHLIELYSVMEGEVPKDSWPPVSNSTFINLVLVKQTPISKFDYNIVRGDVDDILQSKEKVTYEEVFREYRKRAVVLVEGRPGSGKTTLVHKVTRDWVKGENVLQGAKLVFLITLRILNFTGKDKLLLDILEVFYGSEVLRKSVEHDLQECGGKGACFILDGLDEYQRKNEEESVIHQLMYKKCLPLSMVIVASRPVATDEIKKYCDKRIEVIGFNKSQIYEYIETYPFNSSDMCASDMIVSLKAYLHQHPNVMHMCYLPVHAAMICFLFGQLEGNISHTETQIYEQFTIATLLRQKKRGKQLQQLESLKNLNGKEKEDFESICKLAFDMIIKSQQVVSQSEVPVSFSNSTSCVLGLLTVEHTYRKHGDEYLYTFHHLTFQEFLAAYHIAGQEEQEQLTMIASEGIKNEKKVMKFYCGLLNIKKSTLLENKRLLETLLPSLHSIVLNSYCVHCAFESQHTSVCNYLVRDSSLEVDVSTPSDFTALGYVISTASKSVSKLIFFNDHSFDYDGVMALSSTDITNKLYLIQSLEICSLHCKSEALNGLLSQLPGLQELDITESNLSRTYIETLTDNIKLYQLRVLKIGQPLDPPCSRPEEVLKLLTFGSHKLEQVYVSNYYWSTNFAVWKKMLCYAFGFQVFLDSDISWVCLYNSDSFSSLCPERFSYCTEVVLVNCGIDDEGAELLASKVNTSVLENLVVDFNRLCNSGAVALAGCMSRCSVLQEVSIQCNSIGDSGATALASALVNCSSLRRLDLQGNGVSDKGAVAIAKAAEGLPDLDLYLHNVEITEEGVEKVLELRSRTKIRTMEFSSSWKAISAAGMDGLRSALKCGSLSTLRISSISDIRILVHELEHMRNIKRIICDEDITEDTLPAFCDLIKTMNRLEYLDCSMSSSINSASAQHLTDSLKTSKFLHSVSLQYSRVSDNSVLVDIVKCCSNIQSLDLTWCSIGLDGVTQLFSDHKSWLHLHTLNLRVNFIGSNGVHVLSKVLAHCNNLCFLDLGGNNIGNSGCSYLAEGLQDHTRLLGLKLEQNKITSDGVAALIPIIRNNHLQELDLSYCKIGSEGVATLMEVICADTLQTLKLYDAGISVEGAVALSAGLKNYKQLVELDISYNNIGPRGMSSLLEELRHCKELVKLNISRNKINSCNMSSLAKSLQYCSNLQVLGLKWNDITSDGVAAIVGVMETCKYLKELYLNRNSLSVDDVADVVGGWQHKNMLILGWSPDNPHRSALQEGKGCCSSCDHLLEIYNNNNYVMIDISYDLMINEKISEPIPKLILPK